MSIINIILSLWIFRVLIQYPYILAALILIYILRDRIPSPFELLKRRSEAARLRRAVAVNPHDYNARRDLGTRLLEDGRPAEALELLTEAHKKDGSSAGINHLMGKALLRMDRPAEAVEYLKFAIGIDPRHKYGESHLYLGEAMLGLGEIEKALESLKAFQTINSTSIEGKYFEAKALGALGRPDEARAAAAEGIRFHKTNPRFRRRRDWRWYVKLKTLR